MFLEERVNRAFKQRYGVSPTQYRASMRNAPQAEGAGGCGTLEELLEIITWKQLGLYLNPIIILNINGFYNPLLEMLQRAVEGNFMRKEHVAIWKVASTAEEAINLLYTTPVWNKEIRKFAAI